MRNLKTVLTRILPDPTLLGGQQGLDRTRLIAELGRLAVELRRGCQMRLYAVAAAIAAFIGAGLYVSDQPTLFAPLVAVAGTFSAGAMALLRHLNDELARVSMLLSIAPELTLEALTEIAEKLEAKL
jgi:hypothetical protein